MELSDSLPPRVICLICRRFGSSHSTRDCPETICRLCGARGHGAFRCRWRNRKKEEKAVVGERDVDRAHSPEEEEGKDPKTSCVPSKKRGKRRNEKEKAKKKRKRKKRDDSSSENCSGGGRKEKKRKRKRKRKHETGPSSCGKPTKPKGKSGAEKVSAGCQIVDVGERIAKPGLSSNVTSKQEKPIVHLSPREGSPPPASSSSILSTISDLSIEHEKEEEEMNDAELSEFSSEEEEEEGNRGDVEESPPPGICRHTLDTEAPCPKCPRFRITAAKTFFCQLPDDLRALNGGSLCFRVSARVQNEASCRYVFPER